MVIGLCLGLGGSYDKECADENDPAGKCEPAHLSQYALELLFYGFLLSFVCTLVLFLDCCGVFRASKRAKASGWFIGATEGLVRSLIHGLVSVYAVLKIFVRTEFVHFDPCSRPV